MVLTGVHQQVSREVLEALLYLSAGHTVLLCQLLEHGR